MKMIKISEQDARIVLNLMARVQIHGNEAHALVAVTKNITAQLNGEDKADTETPAISD